MQESNNEVWKDVPDYEGLYQVSNLGRVRSLDRVTKSWKFKGRILKPLNNGNEYLRVKLSKDGIKRSFLIHRLVAMAFLEVPKEYYEVNHLDTCKSNNNVTNLEVCDRAENLLHAWSGNSYNKLKKEDVRFIRRYFDKKDINFNAKGLAEKFGVSMAQIYNVVAGRSHRNV